jgi:hypothetical protein
VSRRKVSVVAVTKKLRSNRRRPPLFSFRRGHRDANGCGGERRTARRATTHLAHRAFVNQNQPRGSK